MSQKETGQVELGYIFHHGIQRKNRNNLEQGGTIQGTNREGVKNDLESRKLDRLFSVKRTDALDTGH